MKTGIEACLMIQDLISEIHKNAKAVKHKKIIKLSELFKFLVLSNKANQNPKVPVKADGRRQLSLVLLKVSAW